jgi:type IV secretory pathway TraG/TraD family ATPase VirD4
MIIDEVHSLKHLPILKSTLVEARKYRVKVVLGTQNKAQFEEHYGRSAATMLASSHTKILISLQRARVCALGLGNDR